MLKSTLWITITSLAYTVLGFVLQIILAARFGATGEMDAYLVASTIPTLLLGLLPGALNIGLIPVFVENISKGRENQAFELSNSAIALFGLALGLIVAIGELFAPWIVRVTAPGFDASQTLLSISVMRILLPTIFLYGVASILSSVFYAQKKPFWPAFSPVFRVIGMFVALYIGSRKGVVALAWGDVLGTSLVLVILTVIYIRSKKYRHWNGLWNPGVRSLFLLLLPWLIGFTITKANPLVERLLASNLPEGNITSLSYAYQIVTIIVTLASKGLSLSLFPDLSDMATKLNFDGLRRVISRSIRILILMIIPIVALLILHGKQGVQIVFERGEFNQVATQGTYWALLGYIGTLIALPMGAVITNTFYAFQDTRIIARTAVMGFLINVIFDIIFVKAFGILGLALGYSIAAVFNLAILIFILIRRVGKFDLWHRDLSIAVFCAGFGGAISFISQAIGFQFFDVSGSIAKGMFLVFNIIMFFAIYCLTNFVLGNGEFRNLFTNFVLQIQAISLKRKKDSV